jgi:hypothetical protein
LDRKYTRKRQAEENWSTIKFLIEGPPNKELLLWRTPVRSIVLACGIPDKLGNLTHNMGYKL